MNLLRNLSVSSKIKNAIFILIIFASSVYFFSTRTANIMMDSIAFEKTIEYLKQDSMTRERIGDFHGYENKVGGELSTSEAKFYIRIFGSKDTIVTKVILIKNETEWQITDLEL